MPRGPVHETVNLSLLAVQAIAYARYQPALPSGFAEGYLAGFLLGTLWITPDLDLAERRNRPRPLRFWGLLKPLWVPYGLLFRHRGLSHTWIAGPLSRILYILFVLQGLSYGLSLTPVGQHLPDPSALQGWLASPLGLGIVAGYFVSQWAHLVLDGIAPRLSRRPTP
ncbi:metal-binding protein [Oceanithermus sp.]|uniref:metal-binding protein n=1 Tax=Oceanithermus sp. TaxID=2268145 RepID=UPI00257F12C7|nr:metal-binding protein [Oceanithermus sp.]